MTLRLLVALAGVLATDQTQTQSVPQLGGGRLGSVQAREDSRLAPESGRTEFGFVRLHNPRTGVTCAMLIVPGNPAVDTGIFRGGTVTVPTDRRPADPMIRNQHSPCVE